MYKDTLYFIAHTDSLGYELWQSDGTDAGTKLVKDIYTGAGSGFGQNPYFEESYGALIIYKDKLFFRASDATNGTELWQSDGTTAGTVLVKDIMPGASSSNPFSLVTFKDDLYFIASQQLWRTDGTTQGTQLLKSTLFSDYRITKGDSSLYLNAYEFAPAPSLQHKSYELYRSDGTVSGTVRLTDIDAGIRSSSPQLVSAHNGRVYFSAYRVDVGRELWSMRPECPQYYFFSNPGETTASGAIHRFKVEHRIEATNLLHINSDVFYQAGKSVEFKPGFEVKAGAVFKAQIEGCGTD